MVIYGVFMPGIFGTTYASNVAEHVADPKEAEHVFQLLTKYPPYVSFPAVAAGCVTAALSFIGRCLLVRYQRDTESASVQEARLDT
jgi:hypothetical protein